MQHILGSILEARESGPEGIVQAEQIGRVLGSRGRPNSVRAPPDLPRPGIREGGRREALWCVEAPRPPCRHRVPEGATRVTKSQSLSGQAGLLFNQVRLAAFVGR